MPRFSISLLVENAINEQINTIIELYTDISHEHTTKGNHSYEHKRLRKFLKTKDAIAVILKDQQRVIGVLMGLPLRYEDEDLIKIWLQRDFDIQKLYFLDDILLQPQYRSNAFAKELLATAHDWIANFKTYTHFALQTLETSNRPFWLDSGYQPIEKSLASQEETKCCWIKEV